MENPIKIDDLGLPLFLETPIFGAIFCQKSLRIPENCLRASQGDRSHRSGSLGVGGGSERPVLGTRFFFLGGGRGETYNKNSGKGNISIMISFKHRAFWDGFNRKDWNFSWRFVSLPEGV